MCKISLWSVEHILNQSTVNFYWISNFEMPWFSLVWIGGSHSELNIISHTWLFITFDTVLGACARKGYTYQKHLLADCYYNDILKYISFIIILTLNMRGPSYLCLLHQYHSCWCPGSLCRQGTSSHDIDNVEWVSPCLIWGRISTTCAISMWRNDIQCKYIFYVPSEKFSM